MTSVFGDGAGAFCGGLADWQQPGWRKDIKKKSPEEREQVREYYKAKIKRDKGKKASSARVADRYLAR